MSLYDAVSPRFQEMLVKAGISIETVDDMSLAGVTCATQMLSYNRGGLGDAIRTKNYADIEREVGHLLQVGCLQGISMLVAERVQLSALAMLMPTLSENETKELIGSLSTAAPLHISQQFPADVQAAEQKTEYSLSYLLLVFQKAHPGVLTPSECPSNRLLMPFFHFAMFKCGHMKNGFALASAAPDFGKLSMKAGYFENVVGSNLTSTLVNKTDGDYVEPRSIGGVCHTYFSYLTFVRAVMQIMLPSGETYAPEAGFVILAKCYTQYASQRATVADICSALNEGFKKLLNELTTNEREDFVTICGKALKSEWWVEKESSAKPPSNDGGESKLVKRLRNEAREANDRARKAGGGGGRQPNLNGRSGDRHDKACFDHFAGKCARGASCDFRHTGEPPAHNPALNRDSSKNATRQWQPGNAKR